MNETPHEAATHHLPVFITGPGQTDVLMVITGLTLVLAVLGFGILYFRLHALPEHIAHKTKKTQYEIVAVLGLISLFTHMHIFWIAGLILAFIDLPDFGTPLSRIAGSVEKIAGVTDETPVEGAKRTEKPEGAEPERARQGGAASAHASAKREFADHARPTEKELSHA